MSVRTVRLDEESEALLAELRRLTGKTITDVVRSGLVALREKLADERSTRTFAVYESIDLGPGGYSIAPAKDSRRAVRESVRRKLRR